MLNIVNNHLKKFLVINFGYLFEAEIKNSKGRRASNNIAKNITIYWFFTWESQVLSRNLARKGNCLQ